MDDHDALERESYETMFVTGGKHIMCDYIICFIVILHVQSIRSVPHSISDN